MADKEINTPLPYPAQRGQPGQSGEPTGVPDKPLPDLTVPALHCAEPDCTATFADAEEAKKLGAIRDTEQKRETWYCILHHPKTQTVQAVGGLKIAGKVGFDVR